MHGSGYFFSIDTFQSQGPKCLLTELLHTFILWFSGGYVDWIPAYTYKIECLQTNSFYGANIILSHSGPFLLVQSPWNFDEE